jgi:hypothetical protein
LRDLVNAALAGVIQVVAGTLPFRTRQRWLSSLLLADRCHLVPVFGSGGGRRGRLGAETDDDHRVVKSR